MVKFLQIIKFKNCKNCEFSKITAVSVALMIFKGVLNQKQTQLVPTISKLIYTDNNDSEQQ